MNLFKPFAQLVHQQFNRMAQHELFEVDIEPNDLWATYLAAFPEGTNPVYKTNTEHDCSCCKHFIRGLGNVAAIIDGKVESVWDIKGADPTYQHVADVLSATVKAARIKTIYRTLPTETRYGAEMTRQALEDGSVHTWNHFHAVVPKRFVHTSPGSVRGEHDASVQVLTRGLVELDHEAFNTVIALINQKALYRGEEHLNNIAKFQAAQATYTAIRSKRGRDIFVHTNAPNMAVSRFRNSVIGTLLVDLSDGVDLETAVASFEAKVAPANYKRPTSLITPKMVEAAMATLRDEGLEQAITRRHATLADVSINNVLWADSSASAQMKDGLTSMLLDTAAANAPAPNLKNATDISVEDFMSNVVPLAKSMQLWLESPHQANFMSLVTAKDDPQARLFKWDNPFSWSYDGNVTDSIQEKVKRAGGNITAPLRVSLAWFNYDDLDIHCECPDGHIYFGNKRSILDVDMNAGGGQSRSAVENLAWQRPAAGHYKVRVNQYSLRETVDTGFVIELAINGQIQQFAYKRAVTGSVPVMEFHMRDGQMYDFKLASGLKGGSVSQEKWGVNTESFVKVNTLMYSPNHWDGNSVGNRHWFFMLDGCVNPQPVRGIYNEFLAPGLEKHRKVFEVIGSKTLVPPAEKQLSGVGFSSTKQDAVKVLVTQGKAKRLYNIIF
jgi:hypothetical protein